MIIGALALALLLIAFCLLCPSVICCTDSDAYRFFVMFYPLAIGALTLLLPVFTLVLPDDYWWNGSNGFSIFLFCFGQRGVDHVLVEGGPSVARGFLSEGLVDRAVIIRAPVEFPRPVPSGMTNRTLQM